MKRDTFRFNRKNKALGFTLNELLVTVTIMGILVSVCVPVLHDALLKAKIASTQNTLRVVSNAVETFAADRGHYPFGSNEPPTQFITNYDAQEVLRPLLGHYLPDDIDLLLDPFTKQAVQAINDTIALDFSGVPDVFGYGYFDYAHFMVPPRKPDRGYGIISFGPDGKDSSLGLGPLPGISMLRLTACYEPSNGLRSEGDLGRFGGEISFPQHIP